MYVEKPLGVSMEWAWKLRKAVRKNKVVFQYGTQQRSQWQFRRACELVRNGYIGEVERVETWCDDITIDYGEPPAEPFGSEKPIDPPEGFDYERWLGPAPVKPYTADRCTNLGAWHTYDYALGFIAGWGAHSLDIAQWGLDADDTSPVRYEGTGTIPEKGLFDTIYAWDMECTYANGLKMRFMSPEVAKPVVEKYRRWHDHGTTFFGTEGWVSVDRGDFHTSDPKMRGIELKSGDVPLRRSKGHPDDFIACMKSREKCISPFEAAIRSDTISHMCDVAIRLNKTIEWDPKEERVVGNSLAQAMLNRPVRDPWDLDDL
jgi:predicted dehydrogenase